MDEKKILAIDFDGTLCEDKYPNIGKAKEDMIKSIKVLKEIYNVILVLWTCRTDKQLEEAIDWCKEKGLIFDYVNENIKEHIEKYGNDTRKVYADYYIDDKNGNIEDVMYKVVKDCFKDQI